MWLDILDNIKLYFENILSFIDTIKIIDKKVEDNLEP